LQFPPLQTVFFQSLRISSAHSHTELVSSPSLSLSDLTHLVPPTSFFLLAPPIPSCSDDPDGLWLFQILNSPPAPFSRTLRCPSFWPPVKRNALRCATPPLPCPISPCFLQPEVWIFWAPVNRVAHFPLRSKLVCRPRGFLLCVFIRCELPLPYALFHFNGGLQVASFFYVVPFFVPAIDRLFGFPYL